MKKVDCQEYEGNGKVRRFSVPFDVLDKRFISVYSIKGIVQTQISNFILDKKEIVLEKAPEIGEKIFIVPNFSY